MPYLSIDTAQRHADNVCMNWKKLIYELQECGFTQMQIAQSVGCKQPSLSDLATGKTKEPIYRIGERLVAMHKINCTKAD